jgi:hypothetical protein
MDAYFDAEDHGGKQDGVPGTYARQSISKLFFVVDKRR